MEPVIGDITETALWAAAYRAHETERRDAHFRDPFAHRLAGPQGQELARRLGKPSRHAWGCVARTCLFDRFITDRLAAGVDLVVNLAAGLDARPYRMALPPSLRWAEVDLPGLLAHKEAVLRDETPACLLERRAVDLTDIAARRELFDELGQAATNVLVLTEGLLLYLSQADVGMLAEDLARPASFRHWILDLPSPGSLQNLKNRFQRRLGANVAPMQFGPPQGPDFFRPHGWRPVEVQSLFKTAARLKRLPFWMRPLAWLPEPRREQGNWPWWGACLMDRGD